MVQGSAPGRAPRVCLVVDHPARDLQGLVLLAHELAHRGAEVFLVPMYETHEVCLLKPDAVVVNYVRFANIEFIRTLRKIGIRIVVLDTEGGILNVQRFQDNARKYLDAVDLYCLWGVKQGEVLRACDPGPSVEIRVTGCPRYDFAVLPWRKALPDLQGVGSGFVLVNANFPVVAPRFQSAQREVDQLVRGMRVDPDAVQEWVGQARRVQGELLEVVRGLASHFPETPFVVRPHPFEEAGVYERAFADCANVRVRQDGTVFEWINGAVAVVHYYCSTAVESSLMGVEALVPSWIRASRLEQPVPGAVSRRADSLEEMKAQLSDLVAGRPLSRCEELEGRREAVVGDWFFRNDGRASARVAEAVLDGQARSSSMRRAPGRGTVALRLVLGRGRFMASVQAAVYLSLGCGVYRAVRSVLKGGGRAAKGFRTGDVGPLVERLDSLRGPGTNLHVRQAETRDAFLKVKGPYTSVRVAAGSREGP